MANSIEEDSPNPFHPISIRFLSEIERNPNEPPLLPEKVKLLKSQIKTIELVSKAAESVGLQDKIFIQGGIVMRMVNSKYSRLHKDIDFVIKGKDNAVKIATALEETGEYDEIVKRMGDTSMIDIHPMSDDYAYADFWWVEEETLNDVRIWKYTIPQDFENFLGSPIAIPDSAFATDSLEIGTASVRYIRPEYIFLTKARSSDERHRYDTNMVKGKLNQEKLRQIQADIEKSGITIYVTDEKLDEFTEFQNAS